MDIEDKTVAEIKTNKDSSHEEGNSMAQVFQATPSLKGFEALKLIKSVMESKADQKKVEKLDKLYSRIDSYKK